MIHSKNCLLVSFSAFTRNKQIKKEGEGVSLKSQPDCWDNQDLKAGPEIKDAKLGSVNESDGICNSCSIQDELKQAELHLLDVAAGKHFNAMEGTAMQQDDCQISRESNEREGITAERGDSQTDAWKPQADKLETAKIIALLKSCAKDKDLQRIIKLHLDLATRGLLENNVFIGSTLVNIYGKCGALDKAQEVFDSLKVRNVVLWTALITAYAQQGHGKKAVKFYDRMQSEGFSPNAMTFSSVLKACANLGTLEKGEEIHVQVLRNHFLHRDVVVASALVDMYAKCGALERAQGVFDELLVQNDVSWNVLISGYAKQGRGEEALRCYERMQLAGFSPTVVTLASVLKACGSIRDAVKGEELHAQIVREHLLETDVVVGTSLVDMYVKCGELEKAQEVFDQTPFQDAVLWNALIAGYYFYGLDKQALYCFEQMQLRGCHPDAATFTCVLNACGSTGDLKKGQELHSQIVKENMLETQTQVANALIDMYVKCGALKRAHSVFQELPVRDNVSWNALIAGYVQHGHGEEALNCYEQMQFGGFSADSITFACILKACGSIGASDIGQEIHAEIATNGWLKRDIMVGTALVDMYAKCGMFNKAREVFDELPDWSVVVWNALITGYAQHELDEEVLCHFEEMQHYGFTPDGITYTCMLKASGGIGAAYMGQYLHTEVIRKGLANRGSSISVALVAVYANCGMIAEAHYLFDELAIRDAVSWSVILLGYAYLGKYEAVFKLFDMMIREGIKPNSVILAILLNVCSHSGLLDKGQLYFETISKGYGIEADVEHYTTLVDLFGRAGQLYIAAALTEKWPLDDDQTIWHTLLSACQKSGDMKLGRWAFKCAWQLNESDGENDASVYINLYNILQVSIDQELQQTR